MKVIIVGGGDTGIALSNLLSDAEKVIIIEKDEEVANAIANKTSAVVIHGDATDLSVLKEAGIEEVDALIVTTGDDKVNLMVSEHSKNDGVNRIIAMVNSLQNEELFSKVGVTSIVSVVAAKANSIKRALDNSSEAEQHETAGSLAGERENE
ncbi:hypothetical protein GF345_01400 [Candidatus Woesearchaeota archaeon]|nr:hypothetical protein [Candidatus Woesearchaeota archaeon]